MRKKRKNKNLYKYPKLILGFFICALGLVIIINSNLGVAPWDVFHIGVSRTINISIGQASMLSGAVIIILDVILKQTIGIATIGNMFFIGFFTDIVIWLDFIPKIENNFIMKVIMTLVGITIFSYGTYLYIVQRKGCGPRDGLMQILHKRTNISVGIIKNIIEFFALGMGIMLGGPWGLGTLLYATLSGFIIQFFFNIHKVKLKSVKHSNLKRELKLIKYTFLYAMGKTNKKYEN